MLLSGNLSAQNPRLLSPPPVNSAASKTDANPEHVIQQFAKTETEFYDAWMQYTYTQTAEIRILSKDGIPQKDKMTIISEVVFKDDGTREVKQVKEIGRLRNVSFTDKDREVINNINPFALTAKDLPLYNLNYLGKEQIDELNCYVFSVKPKNTAGNRLYFDGRIWVDDQDLQIVRTIGLAVPQSKDNLIPEFETIRQKIDRKYWFPVWTHAESELKFPDNDVVHIEETITFENYKKFESKTTIQFGAPAEKLK
jgi:hypothetical protein